MRIASSPFRDMSCSKLQPKRQVTRLTRNTRWKVVPFPVQDLCLLLDGKQRLIPVFLCITDITTTAYRRHIKGSNCTQHVKLGASQIYALTHIVSSRTFESNTTTALVHNRRTKRALLQKHEAGISHTCLASACQMCCYRLQQLLYEVCHGDNCIARHKRVRNCIMDGSPNSSLTAIRHKHEDRMQTIS